MAAGSKRARLALQAMRAPRTLAAAARDTSSEAAHMALLQALLAASQVSAPLGRPHCSVCRTRMHTAHKHIPALALMPCAVTASVHKSPRCAPCLQGQRLQLGPGQADGLQRQAASWDVPQHVVASLHSQLHGNLQPGSPLSQLQGLSLCSPSGACYRCCPGCSCLLVPVCVQSA